MSSIKIKIIENDKGKRLDHFLVEKFPEKSRNQWQKKIKSGAVLVNNEPPAAHRFLKAGDEIKIKNEKLRITSKEKIKFPKYKLLAKTKDYLIVLKPAGALTHSDGRVLGLADAVAKDFSEIKKVGEEGRPGIVHRLDKDVSGLIVIARTEKFYDYIKTQFSERKVKKIYLALVYGEMPRDEEILEFEIGRAESGRMAARPVDSGDKEAKTYVKVLKVFKNYSYLEAQIFTGRTHQIRAHLLAYGYPIVGDKIYKPRRQKIKNPGLERLFLHSHILGFADINGKWVEYKSNLPKELKECLLSL